VTGQMLQDQWDTNCIFTELAGFYTLESDQDKLTLESGIIGGSDPVKDPDWKLLVGKPQTVNFWCFPRKETTCLSGVKTLLTEKGVFDARLLSIKDSHEGNCKTLNEGLIPKGY